jgi:hypothetical protein
MSDLHTPDTTPTTDDATRPRRRRLWALGLIGVLGAGAVGVGALTTLETVLGDNRLEAELPEEGETAPGGARLEIDGQPLVHTFQNVWNQDPVEATWVLTNRGTDATSWNGTLEPRGTVPDSLARALEVEYGVVSGGTTTWYEAGTFAEPRSFADAVGAVGSNVIAGEGTIQIAVRVSLPDPTLLDAGEADTGATTLAVDADFVVSYLNPRAA